MANTGEDRLPAHTSDPTGSPTYKRQWNCKMLFLHVYAFLSEDTNIIVHLWIIRRTKSVVEDSLRAELIVFEQNLNLFAEYYSTEFSTLNISFEIDFNFEVETRNIILMQISLRNQFWTSSKSL